MSLRVLYALDGYLMVVVGFAFWGYHARLASWFGIDTSGPFMAKFELWKAVSFGGLFGGALMAFGFASLAISRSRDAAFLRSACGYFLAAHGFLGFVAWAKQLALWETTAGLVLLDVAVLPATGFLYFLIAGSSSVTARGIGQNARDRHLRDAASQEERSRLAQDLHDSVKQQIYSVQANLAAAQTRWQDDRTGAREALDHARDSARDAMAEMIALLDRLRQDPIEAIGLVEALRRQSEALGFQTGAAITTAFGVLPDPDRVAPRTMTTVFRIAQEALANVARHARPSSVHIEAGVDSTGSRFVLVVRDDGRGFTRGSPSGGMGLSSMEARALEIGARLEVDSADGEGCTVALSVPLIDPVAARRWHHQRRLLAAGLPLAVLALTALAWADARTYLWPVIAAGAAFEAIHAWALVRLQWT